MEKNVWKILTFVISFTMCTPKPQTDGTIFVDLDKPEKASLFDYFRSIELIPLETSSEALIFAISKMIIHEDKYYALDKRQRIIFVFDKTGQFLFKIDKKGLGAGEYLFIEDFNINPFTGNMEILEPYGSIHVCDALGNFIEKKRVAYPGFKVARSLAALDSNTYVAHSMFEPKKILYFNLDEQKLLHEEFEEDMPIGSYSNIPYEYQGDWFFFRPFHPVVYRIGKERLEVFFNLILGNIPRKAGRPFSRKRRKGISLKEQKKCMTNFLI